MNPKPAFTDRTFGIELEIVVPASLNSAALVAALNDAGVPTVYEGYNHSTRNYWKLVTDGSIRASSSGWAIELVSPVLSGEAGLATVRTVCELLARLGVSSNRSCGYHVHHGARDFKARHFEHLFSLYRNSEKAIDLLMPPSRRDNNNHYCASLKNKSARVLQMDRYHKLNLCSFTRHGTVEFRHHAGTVNAEKVIAWIKFTQRMVERSKRKVNAADHDYTWFDVKQLLGLVHTDSTVLRDLAAFYEARRARIAVRMTRTAPASA